MSRYRIGVDLGTESGRAVLVDLGGGHTLASSAYRYAKGVIDAEAGPSGLRTQARADGTAAPGA